MKPQTGDALRVVPMFLWVLLVAGGVIFLTFNRTTLGKVHRIHADRNLPQNTLLRSDTLRTEFTGRYLVKPAGVKAGESIQDGDVGDEPIPPAAVSARFLLAIPVPLATIGSLNAGSKVSLCADASLVATVLYVHCEGTTDPACTVTVDMPTNYVKSLADRADSGKTLRLAEPCT